MSIIRSAADRKKEQNEHAGLNKYKIFYKSDGKRITVDTFWAKDADDAKLELDIFKQKNALVGTDEHEYFYGRSGGIICDIGNGMEEEFDDLCESTRKDETPLEKIKYFFLSIWWLLDDIKYIFADFWFWFKHYDPRSHKSHQRFESWNLDSAMIDMLEFNIPIIIRDKDGVPNDFCVMAREKLHGDEPGFDVAASFSANPNPNDVEMELACKIWDDKLEEILLHIRLYRYYSEYGVIDDGVGSPYFEIAEKYKNTIPYVPGTDMEIDHAALGVLIMREWHAIWKWIDEFGQFLWT